MEGDLPGYGTVWYHPSGIANILSLGRVWKRYRITFDSEVGNRFLVTKPDGTTFEFKESANWTVLHGCRDTGAKASSGTCEHRG